MTGVTEALRRQPRPTQAIRQGAHAFGRAARAAFRGPGRERDLLVQSLKASAAAILAWLVAGVWMGDPMALMAPWVAVVLVQATVFSSLIQAVRQLAAICCGAVLASVALAVTGSTLGAVALSVPLLVLLANWPRFGDQGIYGATTALFTLSTSTVGVSEVGHRVGQAALGAVIGIAVNAFVLPPIHLRDVRENLAALAREAGDVLHTLAGDLRDGEWDVQGWSHASARLERRLEALRSARGWSRESLRLTAGPRRAVRRLPASIPPEQDDERWSRVTGHIRALTRTLVVAADEDRAPVAPAGPVLDAYADLLQLIGDACHAESDRLLATGGEDHPDDHAEAAMRELRGQLQDGLREHAGQGAEGTTVLGTLLLQAENLWSETVPTGRNG
ncbi:aromatic acid exporter family protein [Streptomyces sp. NPDC048523]|uniref:FUSC family protein n=1 Tax=Streptomyces sp. NPDC048523 TaxID=3365567 RepID=UPI00371135EC